MPNRPRAPPPPPPLLADFCFFGPIFVIFGRFFGNIFGILDSRPPFSQILDPSLVLAGGSLKVSKMSIFKLAFLCAVLGLCLNHAVAQTAIITDWPTVQLPGNGVLTGITYQYEEPNYLNVDKPIDAYLGVPYAAPPVGDLRFADPVPHCDTGGIQCNFWPRWMSTAKSPKGTAKPTVSWLRKTHWRRLSLSQHLHPIT